ncbi:MAG: LemA family protein [Planctomycetota bacterium]|jgi:LemA protein|nr:hypothetical protein [Planctomycetota bacterium]MDP6839219.1 LemA family protein [Planctomycetota bacterium]MDP6955752.1 LemA family protein [Planctomycetota bacterium]
MPLALAAILGLLLLPLAWALVAYNRLVAIRNHCREAWADVDTELKRRYELIPNLVQTVKGYAGHERLLFEQVTELRARAQANEGPQESQARDENALMEGLGRLVAVAESYPELKASSNFLELQRELATTENRIQAARRFYNGNVRENNNLVEQVPSNLVASLTGFARREYFQVESASEREAVQVDM